MSDDNPLQTVSSFERSMKKANRKSTDELRAEYNQADFPGGLARGKYAKRISKSSNIVVIRPEVAEAFPNEEAVNAALLSLIDLARRTSLLTKRSNRKG